MSKLQSVMAEVRPWIACFAALFVLDARLFAVEGEAFQKNIAPFLKQHCYSCHGPQKQESRLRLDQVVGVDHGNRNLWTMVHERIAAGEMPPKDRPQPPEAEKKQVLT